MAQAMHLYTELIVRYSQERRPIAADVFSDASAISAMGNDYGFENVFTRWIAAKGRAHAPLIIFSTSGNSENVIRAARIAHSQSMDVLAILGRDGGALLPELKGNDVALVVPHDVTARIQEMHLFVIHALCKELDVLLATE